MTANVLSRVAERVYWLGRYLERAESTARLITVNTNLIMDLPVRLPLGWRPLIDITGSGELFESLYGKGTATERNVCRFLATDTRNSGSIINSIVGLRENARTVRENMPRITFEYINELYLFARSALVPGQSRSRRGEALTKISRLAQQLEGFLSQNMLHDAHWELLRLGNYIERADMTTRIIDVRTVDLIAGHHELEPFQDIQWRSVLRSFYAMQAYHSSVREPVAPPLVLEFLFKDQRLPRSYLRCAGLHGDQDGVAPAPINHPRHAPGAPQPARVAPQRRRRGCLRRRTPGIAGHRCRAVGRNGAQRGVAPVHRRLPDPLEWATQRHSDHLLRVTGTKVYRGRGWTPVPSHLILLPRRRRLRRDDALAGTTSSL